MAERDLIPATAPPFTCGGRLEARREGAVWHGLVDGRPAVQRGTLFLAMKDVAEAGRRSGIRGAA